MSGLSNNKRTMADNGEFLLTRGTKLNMGLKG